MPSCHTGPFQPVADTLLQTENRQAGARPTLPNSPNALAPMLWLHNARYASRSPTFRLHRSLAESEPRAPHTSRRSPLSLRALAACGATLPPASRLSTEYWSENTSPYGIYFPIQPLAPSLRKD